MSKVFSPLIRMLDRWASRRVVRVALFGQGLAIAEWESLTTTPYLKARPRIQLVEQPAEAEVLAIHGPLTDLNWPLLIDWVSKARPDTLLLGIGAELVINSEGALLGPQQYSEFKVQRVLPGQPPTPEEILLTVREMMEIPHV